MAGELDQTLRRSITLTVNGRERTVVATTRASLADVIREQIGLTGTHLGCEQGVCGACTVKLDGATTRACLVLGVQCHGAEVTTIEGVAPPGRLSLEQEAFWEKHGLQCGFCTPGMIITAQDLLDSTPDPTAEEVREAMSANVCRCTGYQFIVDAVLHAAELRRSAREGNTPV
jgi:carbon-monoxide dehydrogenase small subunit